MKKFFHSLILFLFTLCFSLGFTELPIYAADNSTTSSAFIFLSDSSLSLSIGDEYAMCAVFSGGRMPTWKSSKSSIASINTYGRITAKKDGTCTITAKIKGAEATCKVTVRKTKVTLNQTSLSLEHGDTFQLNGVTSNGSKITWKTSKKSVATVSENGLVTALKPGTATITAKADTTSVTCKVTVKKPTVTLNHTSITLYRNDMFQLYAKVSSKIRPTWKSSSKSVAAVDSYGMVKAVKHGTCTITATVDGVSKKCTVKVLSPEITLNASEITLAVGETFPLIARVSSGNPVVWSTSSSKAASVSATGVVTALKKGKSTIYASEDGTKVRCIVHVIDE
ncbi:MAG: Ig-like domain-containing protein [Clostridiales bacterium]|nr:Ig-like domain-containing protein [Clostridiales bacterium]